MATILNEWKTAHEGMLAFHAKEMKRAEVLRDELKRIQDMYSKRTFRGCVELRALGRIHHSVKALLPIGEKVYEDIFAAKKLLENVAESTLELYFRINYLEREIEKAKKLTEHLVADSQQGKKRKEQMKKLPVRKASTSAPT